VLDMLGPNGVRDPKSELQELAQAQGWGLPVYEVTSSGGPAHDRWFEVQVNLGGKWLAKGVGRSKRLAERAAAEAMLEHRAELSNNELHDCDSGDQGPSNAVFDGEPTRDTLVCQSPVSTVEAGTGTGANEVSRAPRAVADTIVEGDDSENHES
ncbi:MAG TPA: putative dsRNA-binding protein, partial [Polyangiaceae bacterium]